MSEATNASGGGAQSSSGTVENNQSANQADNSAARDSVKYETYSKVLNEKKRRDEENADLKKQLEAFQSKEKARDEQALKEKEDYKKLVEIRDKELSDEKAKLNGLRGTLETGLKRGALLGALNGTVDEQYYSLIDLKDVVIDPATGSPDEASVLKAARDFETKYPLVIKRASGNQLPGDAAKGGSTKLSYEAWLALPLKEQRARMKDVL